ncbi:hypothetical protein OAX95_00745 [bacterium]|nr:hypothetical protein [bacterium]
MSFTSPLMKHCFQGIPLVESASTAKWALMANHKGLTKQLTRDGRHYFYGPFPTRVDWFWKYLFRARHVERWSPADWEQWMRETRNAWRSMALAIVILIGGLGLAIDTFFAWFEDNGGVEDGNPWGVFTLLMTGIGMLGATLPAIQALQLGALYNHHFSCWNDPTPRPRKAVGATEATSGTTGASAPTATSKSTTTTTEPAPEFFPPEVFTGSGQQAIVVEDGSWSAGSELGVAELTHDGGSNFQVRLLDAAGERIVVLVNEIGPYAGRRPWALRDCDLPRFIEVNADGNWSITVFDMGDQANQRSVVYEPGVAYPGLSDDVFFLLGNDGPVIMDFVCSDCDSNILVTAYSDQRTRLINEIGDGEQFQASVVVPSGSRLIEVETHGENRPGNWVATFR